MRFRKLYLPLLFLFLCLHGNSQEDSCSLRVSLLTCSPGDELYSVFGHSAIRVVNTNSQKDLVYNYGTFDFEDPDFYVNFAMGRPVFALSVERFTDFMREYTYYNRKVVEQELLMPCERKIKLVMALDSNAREDNRYYKYEYLLDNCSTRIRDMLATIGANHIHFNNILPPKPPTFRRMIHEYLDAGDEPWSKLGIDLLLGSRLDKAADNEASMFLPDYLMKGVDAAQTDGKKFAAPITTILPFSFQKKIERTWFTPLLVSIVAFVIGCSLSFVNNKFAKGFMRVFDTTLFFLLGLFGCLLLFMWFGTDHLWCADNFNLLWAPPFHLVIVFVMHKNRSWVNKYFMVCAVYYLLLLLFWSLLPQNINFAVIPVAAITGIRCLFRSGKFKGHGTKTS
jgi:hypothetical protein